MSFGSPLKLRANAGARKIYRNPFTIFHGCLDALLGLQGPLVQGPLVDPRLSPNMEPKALIARPATETAPDS